MSLSAYAQFTDSVRLHHPWMELRDSTNPLTLDEVQIGHKVDEDLTYHEHSAGTRLEAHLQRSPGIELISRGNFGKEVVMRGMNTDRVQITIDGMPVRNACIGKMDPATSYVESNNLEKMEVGAGGDGLQLSGNTGGNLNFQTLDPRLGSPLFYGNAGFKYETNGAGQVASLQSGWRQEQWGVLVNGTYHRRNDYRAGDATMVQHSQYRKINMALAGKWKVKENQVIDADVIIDEAWNVGYPALPMDAPKASAQIGSMEWKVYEPAKQLNWWKLKLFANSVYHVMDNFSRDQYSMRMTMPGKTTVTGARWQMQWEKASHTLDLQAEAARHTCTASMTMFPENEREMHLLTWPAIHRYNSAAYANYTWQHQRHRLAAGGRFEGAATFANEQAGIDQWEGLGADIAGTEYRLSGGAHVQYSYQLFGNWQAFAKAAYLNRLPNVSEQYGLYVYNALDNYAYLGNPALQNEQSLQGSAGVAGSGPRWQLKSEVYYNCFSHYITARINQAYGPLSAAHHGVKQYINLPSATMAGAEASATWLVADNWIFHNTLSYVWGAGSDGMPLAQLPPLTASLGVKFKYQKGFLSTSARSAAPQHRVNALAGEDASPGFIVWHAATGYEWEIANHRLQAHLQVQNITNAHYHHHLDWNNVPQPGRNFSLELNWKF